MQGPARRNSSVEQSSRRASDKHIRCLAARRQRSGKYGTSCCKEEGEKSGKESDRIRDKYKTSLIAYLAKDRPGSLYELLGAFAKRGVNLTKIESRPSKKELGDYYFYIDFEGSASDALIKDALEDIKAKADMLKVLGSYPALGNSEA